MVSSIIGPTVHLIELFISASSSEDSGVGDRVAEEDGDNAGDGEVGDAADSQDSSETGDAADSQDLGKHLRLSLRDLISNHLGVLSGSGRSRPYPSRTKEKKKKVMCQY